MREQSKSFRALIIFIGLISLIGLLAVAGSAAALDQVDPSNNSTQTPTQIEDQLGDLIIHDYQFIETDRGAILEIETTWRGETPTTLGVSQLPSSGDRAVISNTRLLPRERSEISIDLISSSDPAVAWTDESLARSRAAKLSAGSSGSGLGTQVNSLQAIPLGAAIGAGLVGFVAYRKQRSESGSPDRLEEEL